jgi:hypothetical protein
LAKSDYAVKQSLTKKGYEVYNEVANRLQDGSDKSKLAANENAFIYARMAESWARIRNEYGDTAYTAKDFMAEHAVNMGSAYNTKEIYTQPMFDVREAGVDNFKDFILRIETRRKEKKPTNKLMFTGKSGVIYTEAQTKHAIKPHHGHSLNVEQLEDIDRNIGILYFAALSKKIHLNNFNGETILAEVKGDLSNYYVSLEFDKAGKIWFKSGQSAPKDAAKNIIKTKIAEGSARSLALDTPRGLSGQNTFAISINNIAETLKSVNNENRQTFNQRAWHGSGMDFNKFNLEKPLPAPGIWYMAGAFTRLKIKRRPGHIKNTQKVKDYRHTSTK